MPGEGRSDRINAGVQARRDQGDCPTVGNAGETKNRIVPGPEHLGAGGGEVDESAGVGALVRRIIQVDPSARGAEASGGVGDHRVAGLDEGLSGARTVGFGAAEAVGENDRRPCHARVGREYRHV